MSWHCLSSEVRKARKPHKCIWCGQPIVPGETYRHERGIFEGEMCVQDWHPECDEAASEEMRAEGLDYEFNPYDHARPVPQHDL